MIGRIAGTLLEKNPPHLLVDCSGVGYEIDVPMSTFYNLPSTGEKIVLLTQLIVREDAQGDKRLAGYLVLDSTRKQLHDDADSGERPGFRR